MRRTPHVGTYHTHGSKLGTSLIDCSVWYIKKEQGSYPNQYRKTVQIADIWDNDNDSTRELSAIPETSEHAQLVYLVREKPFQVSNVEIVIFYYNNKTKSSSNLVVESTYHILEFTLNDVLMGKAYPTVGFPIQ